MEYTDHDWDVLEKYVELQAAIQVADEKLAGLFSEFLNMQEIDEDSLPIECPLCKTGDAITAERLGSIRSLVERTDEYRTTKKAAGRKVDKLSKLTDGLVRSWSLILSMSNNYRWIPEKRGGSNN